MLRKFSCLLSKNFLVQRRKWKWLILEISLPFLLIAPLSIIKKMQVPKWTLDNYYEPILVDGNAADLETRSVDGATVDTAQFAPTVIFYAPNSTLIENLIRKLGQKLSVDEWWGEHGSCTTSNDPNHDAARFIFKCK